MPDGWTMVSRKQRKPKRTEHSSDDEQYTKDSNGASSSKEKVHYQNPKKITKMPITLTFSMALQKARNEHNLTRLQLANLINEKEIIIQNYENEKGSAQYSVINKINKELNITLPKLKKIYIDVEDTQL